MELPIHKERKIAKGIITEKCIEEWPADKANGCRGGLSVSCACEELLRVA